MKWLILCLIPTIAWAKMRTEKVIYEDNGIKMEGYLAFDDKVKTPKPGVLVLHDWMGLSSQTEGHARDLAQAGYVAFAADIYGQGIRPKDGKEAAALAGKYKSDIKLFRVRAQAALNTLSGRKEIDKSKLAAIGFCFGGTAALELARSGAELKALVSFHGGLATTVPSTQFAPKILILHGADDPFVPEKEVLAFQQEMRTANADWQFISYGNAVHAFTNPEAGSDPSKGAAFNKVSSERAFSAMKSFFKETLH